MMFSGWVNQHQPKVIDYLLEENRVLREFHNWGYDRIEGALKNLGHKVSPTTIANILRKHGIEPAPERRKRTTWKTFLKAHWETFAAADFFTIEVWTLGGLVTFHVLFFMELSSRRVHIAGITQKLPRSLPPRTQSPGH